MVLVLCELITCAKKVSYFGASQYIQQTRSFVHAVGTPEYTCSKRIASFYCQPRLSNYIGIRDELMCPVKELPSR